MKFVQFSRSPQMTPQLIVKLLIVLIVALLAHALILLPLPLPWRAGAALLLTGLLPGSFLVELLVGNRAGAPLEVWERILYSIGAGACIIVVAMLLLSYLPGPIVRWQTFVLFDAINLLLALGVAWRSMFGGNLGVGEKVPQNNPTLTLPGSGREQSHVDDDQAPSPIWGGLGWGSAIDAEWPPLWTSVPRGWLLAALISLALVAGFLRLPNLHYSEFQGDEARVLLRTAEAIQGYDDALMTHKKGPAEILLPSSIYSLVERINEASARLPFSLLNLTALFAIFLLGWRLFGAVAGWIAAILLALDGYFIGFARIVQYQSIVFCLVVLTVLILYRLVRSPRLLPNYLTLAAIFLGTALLAHYEGALAVVPGVFLLVMLWRRGISLARLGRLMLVPLLVGAAIIAAFYVPFVLNPAFGVTYAYITVNRIGQTFPYNNLVDFVERTTLYSTTYYVALMALATVAGLARLYWQKLPRIVAWIAIVLLLAGMVLSTIRPAWLLIGGQDHTWFFFALALVVAWLAPRVSLEERVVWLWFGTTMIFMLFFTLTPNTHVYGFIIGWALVVGMVLEAGYQALAHRLNRPTGRLVGAATAALLVLFFANYATWYFVLTDLEVLRNWRTLRPPGYWIPYEMPTNMSIFGFPLQNGWKAVGALYADGVLDAPFALHGKEPVADWYTRGEGYCVRDHLYYLWHESVEPMEQGYNSVVRQQIEDKGYQLFGEITVNEQPRLAIYQMSALPLTPQRFAVEDFATRFDDELSGPLFEEDGPTAAPQIQKPTDFRFGDTIRLLGYTLRGQDNVAGGGVYLTLYWRADAPVQAGYSISAQVIDQRDGYKAGQRDGEPVCNMLPTNLWQSGEIIADRYYIPLAADARAGTYTLLLGMYEREAGQGVEISSADGTVIGESIGIDEVRIAQP